MNFYIDIQGQPSYRIGEDGFIYKVITYEDILNCIRVLPFNKLGEIYVLCDDGSEFLLQEEELHSWKDKTLYGIEVGFLHDILNPKTKTND